MADEQGNGEAVAALRVTGGDPTPEELAALVGVLLRRVGAVPAPAKPVRSMWRASAAPTPLPPAGRGGWRASALPR